ncbi:trehalose synthase [Nocardioides scoriae]|uniref:Trehalose synthase n=1 Tax=Nocardioides scoriae TaxID=642780 RepID=A0A1H1VA18_9ACTN|nr:maltose alpha-D-glucosyltransferase [Nocardioides scoriae]SDS81470.1 trehalose synthase [Nocardioides scoriae]
MADHVPATDPSDEPDQTTGDETVEHEASEITYSEQFFPARPRSLKPRARLRPQGSPTQGEDRTGEAVGTNPFYVAWLQRSSMLRDANTIAGQFSGRGSMWQRPFATPDPREAIRTAGVWFTAYPLSMLTKPGTSFLGTLADPALWTAFEEIGIDALHTGPVKRAGGLTGWQPTPSVDGHFDRISTQIDSAFGTEEDFRTMCEVASEHGGTIIDDIVPGHTGKGADFRLAEMAVEDYPGIYHMVMIEPEDWPLLPEVPEGADSVNLDAETEDRLAKAGYIIGQLQRVIFYDPGVKDTNWSATAAVVGPDGIERRWVYLHYFKEGQPSINWLDPSFAGMRLVFGDALHSLGDLGSGALRLDANGFLGVEIGSEGLPAWSEGHPLSEAANHLIASMVRKVGGFTFQELNLTIDDIRETSVAGADLSYDFVNRPAYHHALAVQDTEFLRLTLNASLELGVPPIGLVHALQNHDELTYELVHFATRHKDEEYAFRGETVLGGDLAETIRADLVARLTGEAAPYNAVFTTNGIASTTASVIAASLGITDLDDIDDDCVEEIKQAHLLLAMFNAWQPGVFALSGWDLCGMLPLPREQVRGLLRGGDTRWIHRAAYDLMAYGENDSFTGMPRGRSLYGPLPDQLRQPGSFARELRTILAVRDASGVATATQVDVPPVSHRGMLVMVHLLADGNHEVTVLNFSSDEVQGTVRSKHLVPGSQVTDLADGMEMGLVDDLMAFSVTLAPHEGLALLVEPPSADEEDTTGTQP